MNRATNSVSRKSRHKGVLKAVKGFYGRRNRCFSLAVRAKRRSEQQAYIGRKLKKRVFKRRWNKLISIWSRLNNTRYSLVIGPLIRKYSNRKRIYEEIIRRYDSGDYMASNLLQD